MFGVAEAGSWRKSSNFKPKEGLTLRLCRARVAVPVLLFNDSFQCWRLFAATTRKPWCWLLSRQDKLFVHVDAVNVASQRWVRSKLSRSTKCVTVWRRCERSTKKTRYTAQAAVFTATLDRKSVV